MKEKWWKKSIIYQIYPKSFQDTNGDGVGDLPGVIRHLDDLKDLGIDVIWLCPINKSPMMDNGYDISDYYAVDPVFGTNEDLDELIKAAGERGIKVLLDLVVNHCSNEHPWFREAVEHPDSKYASYFIIEETDGEVPNNLRCYTGTSAWERIGDSNRFYFHVFSKEQPDLNWANPEVRREIISMMLYWQKKGIAGFRVDAIGNLKKADAVFRRENLPADGDDGLASPEPYVLMQDGIEEYLAELRDQVFEPNDMFTVAEVNVPKEKMPTFVGEHGMFSTVFDFSYTDMDIEKRGGKEWKRGWTVKEFKEKIFASQKMIQKYGWGSPYLENHDQPRSVNKYIPEKDLGYESKTALGALYFFLRGTPFIYQGQEIGMENYPFANIGEIRDPFALDRYAQSEKTGEDTELDMKYFRARGRDNSRTPMQWNAEKYAGFSEHEPWIGVNPDYTERNVEQEKENAKSIYHFYQKMIGLRKNPPYSEVLTFGDFEAVTTEQDALICYARCLGEKRVNVMINFGAEPVMLPEKLYSGAEPVILNNYEEAPEQQLLPYQAVLTVRG